MRVGEWEATLIELARYEFPGGASPLFSSDAVVEGPVEMALNVLLLRRGGRVLLVDPGTGVIGEWFARMGAIADLGEALAGHGVERERVDLVLSTHLDPDHAGGLVAGVWPDDLRPAFPNARVALFAAEADRYRERDPLAPRNAGTPVLAALERAGVLELLREDAEVAPGVFMRHAPGHSPGHAIVEVAGDPRLIFITDTVHSVLHVEHPEWGNADQDIPLALATRRRVLGELASGGGLAWGAHLRGPAAGRVEASGDAFRWRLEL